MTLFAAASALALGAVAAPATAQMNMPGMHMPMPEKKKSAKKKAPVKVKAMVKKNAVPAKKKSAAAKPTPAMTMPMQHGGAPATPQQAQPIPGMTMPAEHGAMPGMTMPTPAQPQPGMPMDHAQMGHGQMGQMAMPMSGHAGHEMNMTGAFGSYPAARESSGTAWQPDTSEQMGLMSMSGDWTLMVHGVLNLVYDTQGGPRGDDKTFASGMLMGMARRPLGQGTLQFKAMLSPDPTMGPSGYPLLLASGETASGRDRLIDRQHPHDFFMELSASVSQDIGKNSSVFVYVGLPGEPAFGPPAFMHREAILDSPEAPITHHWLDSTHITFGVVTAGLIVDRFKIEASRFNGREPDQHRWNIETGPLDSTSVRLSWNPTRTLALQGSWARLIDPEELEPGVNQTRWSASALWGEDLAPDWHAAATLAWGRKSSRGHNDDGVAIEGSLKHSGWTLFGRGEWIENRELTNVEDGPAYRVGKVSVGALRDFRVADHLALGLGGLFAVNFVPDALAPSYGGHNPTGAMAFVRLKLD